MLNWSNVSTKRNEVRWRVDLCSAADCCSDAQLRATQLQDVARLEYRHRESNMVQSRMILSIQKILNSCDHDGSVAAMSHPLVRNLWTEGQQSAKPWPGGPWLRDQCDYSRGVHSKKDTVHARYIHWRCAGETVVAGHLCHVCYHPMEAGVRKLAPLHCLMRAVFQRADRQRCNLTLKRFHKHRNVSESGPAADGRLKQNFMGLAEFLVVILYPADCRHFRHCRVFRHCSKQVLNSI